ncbi:sn-glycerol-3-phosphate ABC transporter ATP-binding protein UgpC [Iamia sp. SCSIO 61187]|uniref:ABC transporter ATP-binding protein n=1 Tax=Iamia sp. SCSIO 61187 TaxID=2722752 RepID=UPI001C62D15F|nr:sn-glycerol-3-phosphate ABC transporter ATP-binding protein UgpC [Iamia sp. SCSIO 61187]QYG92813.1 sn-glycerol-3-phosphate ABC transporter ATP-binding protein UgpC [Iamia sp. SCSIO 61187]
MAEIALDKVSKEYGDGFAAVKEADFTIGDGEFFILVGPSGCGKSTLLNMIVGLEDITSGEMRVDGERVNDVDPKDRNMAMVFQSYAIYPHMTVRENMEFPLKLRKVPKEEMRSKVEEAARMLELTEHLDRKPGNLSGGQRQRVAMGRAIVREPVAFLMDEPLSNLDAKLRVQMRTTISRLQQRLGTTTIYVTHDQVEAMTLGDRVAVMRRGVVQQVDSPRMLYTHPANLFVAGFIGSPSMNLLPAQLDGSRLSLPMLDLDLPASVTDRLAAGAGGEVIAGIRPENFEDASLVGDREAPGGTFTAAIDVIEWLGSELFAHFEVEGSAADQLSDLAADLEKVAISVSGEGRTEVTARLDVTSDAQEREDTELWIDARAIHLFDPESGRSLLSVPGSEAQPADADAPALAKS